MGTKDITPRKNEEGVATLLLEEGVLNAHEYLNEQIKLLKELQQIIDIATLRLTDDNLFHTVIKEVLNRTDQYPLQLASELNVSGSTMSRWMNMLAAPHPAKKPHIYAHLEGHCRKELRKLNKRL